ncbi:capsular polysaccharide export protein, LipB/KpsS family [Sphingomonas sp. PB4P5]|uniref:capsular polysaccharide export protein, LipB/KpsS family n=1 Tax=Parasphingomonas puruogangriensis TaxID=3096155 RepID=UPI002FC5D138
MAKSILPLLRSPPFAGVPVAVAAVSAPPLGDLPSLDEAVVEKVLAAVRGAALGGAFWGVRATPAEVVLRVPSHSNTPDIPLSALRLDRKIDRSARRAINPWSLLRPGVTLFADGDDEWAAIALLAGASVRIVSPGAFGAPGEDHATLRRRVAMHLLGCRYRDPFTQASCSLDEALAILMLWRDVIAANRGIVAAAGMAWWKRAEIRRFLWTPQAPLRFLPAAKAIRHAAKGGGSVAIWPSRVTAAAIADAGARRVPLVQVEDGFVRSVGLGANLVPPLSVTVDRRGIHYDPSGASELETRLEQGPFPPALLERAAALRTRIVVDRISKYGGAEDTPSPPRLTGRRLVLVPGQVEDDRSVLLGGGEVAGNLDLLRRVRATEPEAEIWFRPHPDVDAGHRRGGLRDVEALAHADRVVRGGSMASLLGEVDAVHVLTSLTGFEALLRGREVVCHGTPFFAGWGLTRDLAAAPARRGRRVTLDELVAATLILYPRYLDPVTMLPCKPETLIARIAERPTARPGLLVRLRRLQGRLTQFI